VRRERGEEGEREKKRERERERGRERYEWNGLCGGGVHT